MTGPSRNLPMGIMAIGATTLCLVGCVVTAQAGGLWWLVFAVLALIGLGCLYGIGESFQKVPRDKDGKRT